MFDKILKHKILSIFNLMLSFVFLCFYGISFLYVITEKQGIHGEIYYYYSLTKIQYLIITVIINLANIIFIVLNINNLINKNDKIIKLTNLIFVLFLILIIVTEMLLNFGFENKA